MYVNFPGLCKLNIMVENKKKYGHMLLEKTVLIIPTDMKYFLSYKHTQCTNSTNNKLSTC